MLFISLITQIQCVEEENIEKNYCFSLTPLVRSEDKTGLDFEKYQFAVCLCIYFFRPLISMGKKDSD
jgi:hypothetical protein